MSNPRRKQAFDFFVSQGWAPHQSAGIVANLEAESGLRPDAVGDGGEAYGLAQWHGPRQAGFEALMGEPIKGSSFEKQLHWVHAELQGTEKAAGTALAACLTAAEAGECVSKRYERPADREGEAAKRAILAESILREIGGEQTAPLAESAIPKSSEVPVFPLLLPLILQHIPQLASVFGAKGEKVSQLAQIGQAVTNAITTSTGTANLQAGLEKMQADPTAKAAAATAVLQSPPVAAILEAQEAGGGGIGGARRFAMESVGIPFWRRGEFLISILLLILVTMIVVDVLFVHPIYWLDTDRTMVLTLAVAITSAVSGYWIGSSIGSMRKTEISGGQN